MPAIYRITPARKAEIAAYLQAVHSLAEANRKFGHAKSTIRLIRQEMLGIAPQPIEYSRIEDSGCYLPTPEVIEAQCKVFRERDRPENRTKPFEFAEYGSYSGGGGTRVFEALH